jgi:acetoin utilization protein AcuB
MLVKNWMSTNVPTVSEEDSMQAAMNLMKEHKVRMLPVLGKGKLVGVVSDTDLKRASASDATLLELHELLYLVSKVKVRDIMTRDPVTVPEDFTVEETAEILLQKKISGVPVVNENGDVKGVITKDDIFGLLIDLSGLGRQGVQFAFLIPDTPGSIKSLTDVIRSYDGKIGSILSTYQDAPAGMRIVYIRTYDIPKTEFETLTQELKKQGALIYYVDHRNNKREIFMDLRA